MSELNNGHFWITCDRRMTKPEIYEAVAGGTIESIYYLADAAKMAAYATEKVWEIKISAEQIA